jgi:hypothetical protein
MQRPITSSKVLEEQTKSSILCNTVAVS